MHPAEQPPQLQRQQRQGLLGAPAAEQAVAQLRRRLVDELPAQAAELATAAIDKLAAQESVSAEGITAALAELQAQAAKLVNEASADVRKAVNEAAQARIDAALEARGGESTAKSMRLMAALEKRARAGPGAEIVMSRISRARQRVISTKLGAASRYVATGSLSMARKHYKTPRLGPSLGPNPIVGPRLGGASRNSGLGPRLY